MKGMKREIGGVRVSAYVNETEGGETKEGEKEKERERKENV